MRNILLFFLLFKLVALGQNQVGFYGFGPTGTWSNHISVNQTGNLILAGLNNSQPSYILATSTGTILASKNLGNDYGEMFGALIQSNGDYYLGGMGGFIGSTVKYIVKYNSSNAQQFAKQYGPGSIRYLVDDGADIVGVGFNNKPSVLKINSTGAIIFHKEYTIGGSNANAYSIHKNGASYYLTGSINAAGTVASFIMSVDATTGAVNWCKTYVGATFSPHFTGMTLSSSGIIVCGTTGNNSDGNLIILKTDFSGNVVWTRQINQAHSWYNRNVGTGYSWGINCNIDPYGAVVVAYEDAATNNRGGVLAKISENTGSVMWIKRYKTSNGDGFHGVTVSNCTYLSSGWFHSTSYKYGLLVCDTSGYAGGCVTNLTRANSTPALTVATPAVTVGNLATVGNYANAVNTNSGFTATTHCTGTSTTCSIPLPVALLSFDGKKDCQRKQNIIKWEAETELNNDFYTLERSYDGVLWDEVVKIKSTEKLPNKKYEYYDFQENGGSLYYRLKQTDYDGKYEYIGEIIHVIDNCKNDLTIYPNPAESILNFNYNSEYNGKLNITFYDNNGKNIQIDEIDVENGVNSFKVDVSKLSSGVYIINLKSNNENIFKKIVIK